MVKIPIKFYGRYSRSLDAKGRLVLPPKFIRVLNASARVKTCESEDAQEGDERVVFWLTAYNGKLVAYLPEDWLRIVQALTANPLPSQSLANFNSRFIGMAEEISPDAQGRIRIPQALLHTVNIQRDVELIGMSQEFEIWEPSRFEALQVDKEEIAEDLAQLGLTIRR